MSIIRYGVVGTGYFGADLARVLKDIEGAKVTCVFDPANSALIAQELACEQCLSLDELVSRSDVDCVIVASPNYLHKDPVLKAAAHKKHVFCEKPIALSYQDCSDMLNACKEHGVMFFAGHIMQFFKGVQYAKELINQGTLGQLVYIRTIRNGWESLAPIDSAISWKKMKDKSGGHLFHHIHELDCAQFLIGDLPEEVVMFGGNVAHHHQNCGDEDDLLLATLKFKNNCFVHCEWGSAFHHGEHYVLLQGTQGYLKLDMSECGGTLCLNGEVSHFTVHENQAEDDDRKRIYHSKNVSGAVQYGKPGTKTPLWLYSVMHKELSYLHQLLLGKQVDAVYKHLLTGEAARNAIATAEALSLSLKEGRVVKLSEITQ